VERVEEPRIEQPTDVVLRVTSSALCGSDLHMYDGRVGAEPGLLLGHEALGVVDQVGSEVQTVRSGDRVVPTHLFCGTWQLGGHAPIMQPEMREVMMSETLMSSPSRAVPQARVDDIPEPGIRQPDPAERGRPRLLRSGHLIDVAGGDVRRGQDVLVEDGRVLRVGANLPVSGAETVDVEGRYLLPGLIDLHVHPGMMVGLRMDPSGQSPDRYKHDLQVWLRYGVTSVQSMGTDRPLAHDVQAEQSQGSFVGARLFSTGNGFGVAGGAPTFRMSSPPGPLRLDDPAVVRGTLVELSERGVSGVKIWYDDLYHQVPKMAPQLVQTIIETCGELNLTSYAHVYYVDDAKLLVGYGLQVLAHVPRDREVDDQLIALLRQHDAAVLPTISVPETNVVYVDEPAWVQEDPFFARFLPRGSVEFLRDDAYLDTIRAKPEYPSLRPDLERAKQNTRLLYQAGVRLGFGTDTGVLNRVIGFYDHRELELLTECGVRASDALRIATLGSAEILDRADELGQIAPGRRADIVVLRENPLESITHTRTIESVWLDGVRVADAL
jgi:imidazolonepropionase-like amidohydrolase